MKWFILFYTVLELQCEKKATLLRWNSLLRHTFEQVSHISVHFCSFLFVYPMASHNKIESTKSVDETFKLISLWQEKYHKFRTGLTIRLLCCFVALLLIFFHWMFSVARFFIDWSPSAGKRGPVYQELSDKLKELKIQRSPQEVQNRIKALETRFRY